MNEIGQLGVAALTLKYGFTDIDGKQPQPLTLETSQEDKKPPRF